MHFIQLLKLNNSFLQKLVFTFTSMKRFLISILALLYLGSTVGATVQMHYCMGKLANWDLNHKASSTCAKCGMEKSAKKAKGCCKDEHKFVKNAADQNAPAAGLQVLDVLTTAIPVAFYEIPYNDLYSITEDNPISHAPPLNKSVAVYIRNCVFLI
ncbi:MAG: hypothetical protein JWP81_3375 [Ferruginibacter sp.]|nr:hypothetical protein [Ferruginibacter sp.]